MKTSYQYTTTLDEEGRLIVPEEVAINLGLKPGTAVTLEQDDNAVRLLRPISHLAQLYVEPTNICNLDCRTCMRNVWDEPYGRMDHKVFQRILDGIKGLNPVPKVFFGGIGEPLSHPDIIDMIRSVKALGGEVELITNGTLLSEGMGTALMSSGLDFLWVSLDGASPESYEDVRLGASLRQVLENLNRLKYIRYKFKHYEKTFQLGIAFVAMERNIQDLPEIIRLGMKLAARKFSISNVLVHSQEMLDEHLYKQAFYVTPGRSSTSLPIINLPRMDVTSKTAAALAQIMGGNYRFQIAGHEINQGNESCQFIEKGSMAIRWDGMVSPCPSLMHANNNYVEKYPRRTHAHFIGNVLEKDVLDLWNDDHYVDYRKRVRTFSFAPCTYCTGCDLAKENLEDCLNNPFPTCGGCLWAQGFIQCP